MTSLIFKVFVFPLKSCFAFNKPQKFMYFRTKSND